MSEILDNIYIDIFLCMAFVNIFYSRSIAIVFETALLGCFCGNLVFEVQFFKIFCFFFIRKTVIYKIRYSWS